MRAQKAAIVFTVSVGLCGLAYANSLSNGFHFDDGHSIQDNAWLRDIRHVPRYFWDVATFSPLAENRSYRPALLIGYALSHAMGGGAPWAYRLVSIALHALASAAIGLMTMHLWTRARGARRLDRPAPSHAERFIVGVIAAATMAVHPLATEAVNYISARSSLQSAALMFIGLGLFMIAYEGRRRALVLIGAGFVLMATATKIIAVTAPALALSWALLLGPRLDRPRPSKTTAHDDASWSLARALMPMAAGAFGFTLLHEIIVGGQARAARSVISPLSFFLTETKVWARYQALFVWPNDLCADLTMRWSQSLWEPKVLAALLWATACIVIALCMARRRPLFSWGVLWFYIALSPTSSFVPLSEPASEHRVYIALPGLIWALLGLVGPSVADEIRARPRLRSVLAVAGVAAFATMTTSTVRRNQAWRDGQSLWGSVLQCAPDNGRAHLNFGRAKMIAGDLKTAEASFERCQSLLPRWIFCRINSAALALARGRPEDAHRHMAVARALQPNNVYTLMWSGRVHLSRRRFSAAERAFRQALTVAPGFIDAKRGHAVALTELGRSREADVALTELAARGQLHAAGWHAWGRVAQKQGDAALSRERFERAAALGFSPSPQRSRPAVLKPKR